MNADDADNPLSRMMANCDFVAIDGLSSIRSTLSAHIRVICVIRGEIDQRRCGAEVSIAQSRLNEKKAFIVLDVRNSLEHTVTSRCLFRVP